MSPEIGQTRRSGAVEFCLESSTGATVCLGELLLRGPVLIWVYRGHG